MISAHVWLMEVSTFFRREEEPVCPSCKAGNLCSDMIEEGMTEKEKTITVSELDRAIAHRYPSIPKSQIRTVRSRIVQYIVNGLEDGYDVALIKPVDDEEIRLKILRLQKE